jgi:hypothetical protein
MTTATAKTTRAKTTTKTDERNIYQRIAAAKLNFLDIKKSSTNPHFKSKFADLAEIARCVDSALANEGVLVMGCCQPSNDPDSVVIGVRFVNIANPEDKTEQYLTAKVDAPQKMGSAITYYRRYIKCLMLDIVAEDDDDGNAASDPQPVNGSKKRANTTTQSAGVW